MSQVYRRRKLYVNAALQSAVLRRVAGYWLFCILTIMSVTFAWEFVTQPNKPPRELFAELFARYTPALIGSLLLLPFVLYDVLRISHRIAGPVHRLRLAMGRILNGETIGAVRFRDHDYFHELAADFNRVKALIPQQAAADWEEDWHDEELRIDDIILRR